MLQILLNSFWKKTPQEDKLDCLSPAIIFTQVNVCSDDVVSLD